LSAEAVPVGDEELTSEYDRISIYVVHKGDTLPAIAKMFDVSVNTIRWANDIKGNTITVGQTLVILPISGISHTVKKGDTLASIAKMHKGDLEEIMSYNNLPKNAKLAIGDVIIVPDGEISAPVSRPSGTGGGKGYSGPSYEGYYMRPIIGGVKTQGIHGHNAVDLASYSGAKIMASAAGIVLIARDSGWNGGYGDYVVIKHDNGTQTLYAHLSGIAVSTGDYVEQGDTIGYMGTTGRSTGIHLHFEIRGAKNPF
jgi:murein DD-endopeptidase MepM/ murein hydrolase activator NlpD